MVKKLLVAVAIAAPLVLMSVAAPARPGAVVFQATGVLSAGNVGVAD